MTTVIEFLAALTALLGALPTSLPAVASFVERLRGHDGKRSPKPSTTPPAASRRLQTWFTDERDRVSRRTWATQGCALVACGLTLALVSISQSGVLQHSATAIALLTVAGLIALVGVASGVDKARVSGANRQQVVLVLTAIGGTAVCLAAWVFSLVVTAPLWA